MTPPGPTKSSQYPLSTFAASVKPLGSAPTIAEPAIQKIPDSELETPPPEPVASLPLMRDVPPNTAKADGDFARIGIPCDQRPDGLSADINVDTADHRHIGRAAHHVSAARNMSLFHQVRDMHRHRGTGDPRLSCQLFL